MAKLYFRYGAMNSGKTALLLQAAYNYEQQGMKVLVAKPSKDTKGNLNIVSRIGLERKINFLIRPDDNVFNIVKKKKNISCLLIDEAQFLEPIQVDQLMEIVVKLNIPVICYGLRTDFKTRGFPGSTRLLELAHTIEEMKTICTLMVNNIKSNKRIRMMKHMTLKEQFRLHIFGSIVSTFGNTIRLKERRNYLHPI